MATVLTNEQIEAEKTDTLTEEQDKEFSNGKGEE